MKKIFILILFFIEIQSCYSIDLFNIQLDKNEKLEGTYSVKISNNQTSHFLIVKNSNTKKYSLKPFLFDSNKNIKELDEVIFDETPNIIANHIEGNTVVLSNYIEKDKTLFIVDFDLKTGKNNFKKIQKIEKPDLIFSVSDRSVIIDFIKNGEKLDVKTIINSVNVIDKTIDTPKNLLKEFKAVIKEIPEAINQNEFVKNGSIKDSRAYLNNNKLLFTNQKIKDLNLFSIGLNDNNDFDKSVFVFGFDKKIKDINSYLLDDNLVVIGSNKEDLKLKIFKKENGKEIKELSLQNDIKNYLDQKDIEAFIKEAKKSSLKTTITLNETKSKKIKVRIDRVNKQTYNYNYNWWFFHHWMMQQQQQMIMQQQMMQNIPRGGGFGPANNFNSEIEKSFLLKEEKNQSLEFILNENFNLENSNSEETFHKEHDKDEVLKEYEDNKNIKEFSCIFLDNELHYVYQDKKTKNISINFKTL